MNFTLQPNLQHSHPLSPRLFQYLPHCHGYRWTERQVQRNSSFYLMPNHTERQWGSDGILVYAFLLLPSYWKVGERWKKAPSPWVLYFSLAASVYKRSKIPPHWSRSDWVQNPLPLGYLVLCWNPRTVGEWSHPHIPTLKWGLLVGPTEGKDHPH